MKQSRIALAKSSVCILLCTAGFSAATAHAQFVGSVSGSLSDSLSDPLSDNSATDGFNTTFDPESSNILNPTLHSDVSDPTHAQLLGSAVSPLDNSYVSSSVNTTPQTGVQADAQLAIDSFSFGFGGRRNRAFAPQAASSTADNSLSSFKAGSTTAAFGGAISGRAAFSGISTNTGQSSLSFSGEGVPESTTALGSSLTQSATSGRTADRTRDAASGVYYATDPVLSGSTAGDEGDLELSGDMPQPSAQTGLFFAESSGLPTPLYEFDDGQTPLPGSAALAGSGLTPAPEYGPSASGFADSTLGLAGLPSEAVNASSPLSTVAGLGVSPFPEVSEGNLFALGLRFSPNLHAQPSYKPTFNFEAAERHELEQRLLHGVSISQASEIYKQDLRKYRRQVSRPLPPKAGRNLGAPTGGPEDLLGSPSIR